MRSVPVAPGVVGIYLRFIAEMDVRNGITLGFDDSPLTGKIFIVTGTGKYFKNVENDPETNLGIVRIAADGQTAELL